MEHFNTVQDFLDNIETLDKNTPVWRGEDGSIVVCDQSAWSAENEDVEYTQDGIVSDWMD